MIRLGTLAWLTILALLGIGLFQLKYEVQAREAELKHLRKQIEANYAAQRVLEAEWSYLNDLERLSDLSRRHTDLVPTVPAQIHNFADLKDRQPEAPTTDEQTALAAGESNSKSVSVAPPAGDDVINAILTDMRNEDSDGTSGTNVNAPPMESEAQ